MIVHDSFGELDTLHVAVENSIKYDAKIIRNDPSRMPIVYLNIDKK